MTAQVINIIEARITRMRKEIDQHNSKFTSWDVNHSKAFEWQARNLELQTELRVLIDLWYEIQKHVS